MKKATFALIFTFLFAGSLWASNHSYSRPSFESLSTDSQVAIGDTKIDEDGEVPSTSVTAETMATGQDPTENIENSPSSGFSVRLISIYSGKKSKAKKVATASDADQNYTIQLSSYLTEAEGRAALQEFQKNKNSLTWMATAQVAGKIRYRIYYGHFKTLSEAQGARTKVVADSGAKDAFVQKVFGKLTAKNDS